MSTAATRSTVSTTEGVATGTTSTTGTTTGRSGTLLHRPGDAGGRGRDDGPGQLGRRRWWMLSVLLAGQAMVVLDTSIVNVAIPDIRRELHAAGSTLQLVISGYTLAYAVLLVTGARLGDDLGHRRFFLGGLGGFVLTSALCGVAPGSGLLVAARVLQGIAAAAMVPQVLSVIQRHFTGADRARALGIYAAVISTGLGAGQILGGLLIGADIAGLGWRPVFLVNVPVGLVLLPLGRRLLPVANRGPRRSIDLPGVVVLSASMAALVLPLILGPEQGWPAWTLGSLASSVVGLAGFVALCGRTARRGGHPVLDLGVLTDGAVRAGLLGVFMFMFCWGAFLFTFTLFMQVHLGYGALRSGLNYLTATPAFALASLFWSRLPGRWHRWVPTTGFLVAAPAYLGIGLIAHNGWRPVPALVVLGVLGLALGAAFGPLVGQTTARVRPGQIAGASGLITTAAQLSVVIGVASLGSLYLGRATSSAPSALLGVTAATAALTLVAAAGAARAARRR